MKLISGFNTGSGFCQVEGGEEAPTSCSSLFLLQQQAAAVNRYSIGKLPPPPNSVLLRHLD